MPTADWDNIDAAQGMLPEGRYLCEVIECEERFTRKGDEFWRVRWQIEDGEFAGREFRDDLYFHSKAALPRFKLFCESIGLVLSGRAEVLPAHTLGRRAWVQVAHETYERRDGGGKGKTLKVPFAGYTDVTDQEPLPVTPLEGAPAAAEAAVDDPAEDDIPF